MPQRIRPRLTLVTRDRHKPPSQAKVDQVMFAEATWIDQGRYIEYRWACQAENLDPHGYQMWSHDKPSGPLG